MSRHVPNVGSASLEERRFIDAVRENLNRITGQRKGATPLAPLPAGATLPEVVAKLNEVIARLQGE